MKLPAFLTEDDPVWMVGEFCDSRLVVRRDLSALPITQILMTTFFYRWFTRRYAAMRASQKLGWSVASTMTLLGSEWCHNLAHVFIAAQIKKPVDAIRINFGMPLLVYYNPQDPEITPREHILRAVGGPLFNLLVLLPLRHARTNSKSGTPVHDITELACAANEFLLTASLAPNPYLDGGPLLKWALIDSGQPPEQAEATVRKANGFAAIIFSVLAHINLRRGKKLPAFLLGLIGLSSLAIALGWLDEAY